MSEKINDADRIIKACRKYRKPLIDYCTKYVNNFEDAEDCVSFAFEKLTEYLKEGRSVEYPKAWLYKVAINEAIRVKRERQMYQFNEYTDSASKDSAIENACSYTPDYLDELVKEETIARCALGIISSLSEEERELYMLYYRSGKTLKEIADILGINHYAARKRHQRLKAKLNNLIKDAEKNYYQEGGADNEKR